MKKTIFTLFLFCLLLASVVSCDENAFSAQQDKSLFEYILRDTEKGEVEVSELDAYSKDGYCYYHVRYTYFDEGELKEMNAVYRARYGKVMLHYNLNWKDDSIIFPMKDEFYDAVEYGAHKRYSEEEIARYIQQYYKGNL